MISCEKRFTNRPDPEPLLTSDEHEVWAAVAGAAAGQRWGDLVAAKWEAVVAETFAAVKTEAERQSTAGGTSQTAGTSK